MTRMSAVDMQAFMSDTQFEIIHSIGAGATAEVFKARNKSTDSYVALKSFSSFVSQDKDALKRLQDEIQILKTFNHPNVVKMLGEHHIDSQLCLELELVEGKHLGDWLKSSRNPLVEVDIWILVQVARGLGAVHEKGFIHRDLKPENILISDDADVKLSDFGLAKELNRLTMTRLGLLVGSLGYMAPEVTEGEKADMKSDMFSFGAVAYELISGQAPISGDTPQALLKNAMEPIEPLLQVSPHVCPRVASVIDRCLKADPKDRPESIWEVESEMMGYLSQTGLMPLCRELVKLNPNQTIFKKALTLKKTFLMTEVDQLAKESKPDKKYLMSLANELLRLFPEEPKGMELLGLLKKKKIENPKRLSVLSLTFLLSGAAAMVFFFYGRKVGVEVKSPVPTTDIKAVKESAIAPTIQKTKPQVTKTKRPVRAIKNTLVANKTKSRPTLSQVKKKVVARVKKGLLSFIVDDDVKVFVDNKEVPKKNLISFSASAGEHKIRMVKEGFMPLENTVVVRANQTTTINTRRGGQ